MRPTRAVGLISKPFGYAEGLRPLLADRVGTRSIWCHVPKKLRESIHLASVRGLKKGGVFILESYHPRQLEFKTGGPPSAELMMTSDILREELKGLHFEVLREIDREVQEGRGHHGRSAVVQLLAAKKG